MLSDFKPSLLNTDRSVRWNSTELCSNCFHMRKLHQENSPDGMCCWLEGYIRIGLEGEDSYGDCYCEKFKRFAMFDKRRRRKRGLEK